jgi:hypothetical protein
MDQWEGRVIGLSAPSEIPSFYTLFRLALVCHDFLDPIIFFQRRGFHGAVMTLAVRGFVVLRIEDG